MKRAFCCVCALALLCSSFSALAVEAGAEDTGNGSAVVSAADPSPAVTLPQPLQVEVTLIDGDPAPEAVPASEPSAAPLDDETAQTVLDALERIEANTQGDPSAVVSAPSPVSSLDPETDERDGLAGVVSSIFGAYTPRTYTTTTYIDGQAVTATEIVPGVAGLDWPWLCGAALFGIMLFCLFKLLGGIWK